VPASAPDLIAVGATLNRTEWDDAEGTPVSMPSNGAVQDASPDATAYFSAAGPNALGALKPEIVAPGMNLVGALSTLADPRVVGAGSMFSGIGACPNTTECLVVDAFHAVSSGTSMASPLVAGAVALLFERDSGLVQHQVRALLQAGARRLEGQVSSEQQVGVGALDLKGSLTAQIAETTVLERVPSRASFISLAASYARPDPEWPLVGYVDLRDEQGELADAFDPRRLSLTVRNARVSQPLTRLGPGFYGFSLVALEASGGAWLQLELTFDGVALVERRVPIAVDRGVSEGPLRVQGGSGCRVAHGGSRTQLAFGFVFAVWCLWRTRRARPEFVRARRVGRTGR
jgi:hypothetical protein